MRTAAHISSFQFKVIIVLFVRLKLYARTVTRLCNFLVDDQEVHVIALYNQMCCFLASCAIARPWEAVVIGLIGGLVSILGVPLLDKMKIDDPVGAISVHAFTGIWVSS